MKLDRHEGGLNLGMDGTKLAALARRGECAGELLVDRFDQPGGTPYSNWNRYRFARYRTAMALLERVLRSADQGLGDHTGDITAPYDDLIASGNDPDLSYRFEAGITLSSLGHDGDLQGSRRRVGHGDPRRLARAEARAQPAEWSACVTCTTRFSRGPLDLP